MTLLLDDMRAAFARYLADNASARFSMDKALAHVVTLAYQRGMDDGMGLTLDTARLLHQLRELGRAGDRACLVLAGIETGDDDEAQQIADIIDALETWSSQALLVSRND